MQQERRVLGVSKNATARDIRRAWRELAVRLHPDVNSAPDAGRQFREALNAYRTLIEHASVTARASHTGSPRASSRAVSKAPPPAPFVCPCCQDGFTQQAECPRCEIPIQTRAGFVPADVSPDVAAMIAALEAPATPSFFELDPALRMPLLATVLFGFGMFQASIGMWPLSLMSISFAMVAVLSEAGGFVGYLMGVPTPSPD